MVGPLAGKVALITGAARGQGRSHAVRLAQDGADVIAVDICRQLDSVAYALASPEDLRETMCQVEALDRRIVAAEADVRDLDAMCAVVADGVGQLGGVDIVLANAGIGMTREDIEPHAAFREVIDVNLTGVWNTVHAAVPKMIEQGRGGSIVVTGSVMGLTGRGGGRGKAGGEAYIAAKHGLVGLTRAWANWLAQYNIRVNSVHPTGVDTPMVMNDALRQSLASQPSSADLSNLLDVRIMEPIDISNAIAWLVSDQARYVTGVALPVDAGFTVK